ncbi:MAG TPA: HAD family hydrolase [Acidobacteriaceae bacterium]|jgi:hydroxymethylpyrimidine pyrophosphatase-like HAD family hydrolase|nr:HAD family hydrolase [Acidobacteriaceae bacterium]
MPVKPRLIAVDMDGTLLNSNGIVSQRNLAAFRHAELTGAEIAIATGRRHCYAMQVLRQLSRPERSALISSNGSVIRTIDSTLLHRSHMPVETARWVCDHMREFRSTLVITFDKVGPDGEDDRGALVCEHGDDLHASIGRWMQVNAPYIEHISPIELSLRDEQPIQMMLCGPIDRMREAEAHLLRDPRVVGMEAEDDPAAEIALHRTEYEARDLCILDILPAGCSKASALLRLAKMRGIDRAETLAIGDNWNDVSMFRVAGRAAVMSNAPLDLQILAAENGWQMVPCNDEDGVAVAIENAFA